MMIYDNQIYSRKEVLELLRLNQRTLRKYMKAREIKAAFVGRAYHFLGSEILRFLRTKQEQPKKYAV